MGIFALVIGFVGIFFASFILSPLAFILGVIAMVRGQVISGIFSIIFAILGLLTSPTFWALLGMGALLSIPFLEGM